MALILQHMVQHIVCMGPCGNMGNGHPHRSQLLQDHGFRCGDQSFLGLDVTMDLGSSGSLLDQAPAWSLSSNLV